MKVTKQNIIAGFGLAAFTGTVGLLVSMNGSLNSQVNSLQAELESLKLEGNNRKLQGHEDKLQGFFGEKESHENRPGLGRRALPVGSRLNLDEKEHKSLHNRGFEDITGFAATAEHASEIANKNKGQRRQEEQGNRRRLKGGKGGKGGKGSESTARAGCSSGGKGKGGKSKKSGGDDCVEEVARQPDPEPEVITIFREASCDQLRGVVSNLTTKIDDLTVETLRFSSLTDELQQTAYVAETGDTSRRVLENTETVDTELATNLEDSLEVLEAQRTVLSTGNGRMTSLNSVLRESTLLRISQNAELSDSNLALKNTVNELAEAKKQLEAERSRLSEQIADLTSLVGDLNEGIDVHKELNGELNASTAELERQIDRLEASNAEYKRLNGELNATVSDLEAQNTELAKQNGIFANLNQDLNVTAQKLEEQVDRLEDEVTNLTSQNDRLEGLVDNLEVEADRLEATKDDLEETVSDLETQVSRLDGEIDELKEANAELGVISSFLNETAGNLDETYESITQFLSQQIMAYRAVATETLQNTYLQRVASWDCAYRDHFREFPFATNENAEIAKGDEFDQVVEYIDSRILSDLCLSKEDFLDFLELEYTDPVFTTNHFVSGVNGYTLLAFDFYFPDGGEPGLTDADWAMAGYDCTKLPDSQLFIYA